MVSIVLPTYNREKYIRYSIDSIINQSFKQWELIVVDDCSTDSTPDILREYEKSDSRIKIIRNEENKRLPVSLNIGFSYATGDYLTWTSDDNMYKPNALQMMHNYLENSNEIMVCAKMIVIDDSGNRISPHYLENIKYDDDRIYFDNLVGACFLYRREVLETIGEYNAKMFCMEDYEYWLRIQKRYKTIGYIEEQLYYYRLHDTSLTETKETRIANLVYQLRIDTLEYLIDNNLNKPLALCALYCAMLARKNDMLFDIRKKIIKLVPELQILNNDYKTDEKYIVYAAGEYGRKTKKILGDQVEYFADNNPELIGTIVDGIQVISVDEMIDKQNEYRISRTS